MIESLEDSKLRKRQIADRISLRNPRHQGIRTACQLDKGVQGAPLRRRASKRCRHIKTLSTSNNLISKYYRIQSFLSIGFP